MDQEIKARWIAALESGKYKQGKLFLEKGKCNCCLGVLCNIMKVEKKKDELESVFESPVLFAFNGWYGATTTIPNDFCGIGKEHIGRIATINDGSDSFEPSIQYIKEYL